MTAGRALVTMFNVAPWGGLHENIWYSCRGMKQQGWDITVACRDGQLVQKLEADGIGVHVVRDWAEWPRDAEVLAKRNWDLVHTHPFESRMLGQAVAEAVRAPFISTFHAYYLDNLAEWADSVSALMAVSPAHAEMVRRVPGVDPSRVFVVRNGVRDALFDVPVSTLDEKTRGGQARVVVASRLDKDKRRLLDCLSAVIEVLGRDTLGIRWMVEILGDGNFSADVQDFLREQVAKAPNVALDMAGWVDSEEVAERMRHAVISIAPGRGAAQSLAVGTPVVAFGSKGIYGLQHGQNLDHGLWANFGEHPLGDRNVTPITSDVALLLHDASEYSRVQAEGRKVAREHLAQSEVDEILAGVYQRCRLPKRTLRRAVAGKLGFGTDSVPRKNAATQGLQSVRAAFGLRETVAVPTPDLGEQLTRAFDSGDDTKIIAALAELHELNALAAQLASPPSTPPTVRLADTSGTSSQQYMIDLLPHIQRMLAKQKRWSKFDVLDVGPGTGHGTALLASLYRGNRLGYQMNVSALDVSATYKRYLPAITPNVQLIHQNLFEHKRHYDIVIASHVIQHLSDPVPFIRRLQEMAKLAVFIVAPFNEPADNLTKGHLTVINEQLVKELDPVEWHTMQSVAWGAFLDPPYEMLIARLAGTADLILPAAHGTGPRRTPWTCGTFLIRYQRPRTDGIQA